MLVRTLMVLGVMLAAPPALAQMQPAFSAPLSSGADAPSLAIGQTFDDAEAALARRGLGDNLPAKARARQVGYIGRKNVNGAFSYSLDDEARPHADYHAVQATLIARRTDGEPRLINFVVRMRPTGDSKGVAGAATRELERLESAYGQPVRCQSRDASIERYVCRWLKPRDPRSKWALDVQMSPGEWSYTATAVFNE